MLSPWTLALILLALFTLSLYGFVLQTLFTAPPEAYVSSRIYLLVVLSMGAATGLLVFSLLYHLWHNHKRHLQEMFLLRKKLMSYQDVFQHTQEAAFILDSKHYILQVNPAAEQLSGYSAAELSGLNIFILFKLAKQKKLSVTSLRQHLLAHLHDKKPHNEQLTAKDGHLLPVIYRLYELSQRTELMPLRYLLLVEKKPRTKPQYDKNRAPMLESWSLSRYWIWNIDSGHLEFSQPLAALLGYHGKELNAHIRTWLEALHPTDKPGVLEELNACIEGNQASYQQTHRIFTRDGTILWLEGKGRYIDDSQSRRFLVEYQDVTEKKRIEQSLQQNQELYGCLFNSSPTPLLDINISEILFHLEQLRAHGVYHLARHLRQHPRLLWRLVAGIKIGNINAAGLALLQVPDLKTLQRHFRKLFTAQLRAVFIEYLQAIWLSHSYFESEVRLFAFGGAKYDCLLSMPVPIEPEKARHVPINIIDISAHKYAEAALRKERDFIQAVLDTAGSLVLILDQEGRIIQFNRSCAKLSAYESQELGGKIYWEVLAPENEQEPMRQFFMRLLQRESNAIARYEGYLQARNGKHYCIDWSNTVLRGEQGDAEYVISIGIDITTRKEMALYLQEAKDKAEIANLAKSQFLANMSHELRTPLNGILGYTQLLQKDTQLNAEHHKAVKVIHRSGEYLLTLINDVLDLSKIEIGRIDVESHVFNLAHFLEDIVGLFQLRAAQKQLYFEYQVLTANFPQHIEGDEKHLRQVLLNILGNAIKFTKPGGKVRLKAAYRKGQLELQVEDTGIGIETTDLERIFYPFQQGQLHYAQSDGSGLGLAISRSLLDIMKGKLSVQSTPGRGSCFTIELPCHLAQKGLRQTTRQETEDEIIGIKGQRDWKILIIDDQTENRHPLRQLLSRIGFLVKEAHNGAMGINVARSWVPDLILLDLVMPGLDGYEVARILRDQERLKKIKIIAISANVYARHQETSLHAGCDAFIAKPVIHKELLTQLQTLLGINWVSKTGPISDIASASRMTDESNAEIIAPAAKHLRELLGFTRAGNLHAILDYVAELQGEQAELRAFAGKIQDFAANYQIKQIRKFLQELLCKED